LIQQYSLRKIALIWAAATFPMAILSWVVAPSLAVDPKQPGMERLAVMTVGLVWQFVLVAILLRREGNGLGWSTIRRNLWLSGPCSPKTGRRRNVLWLFLLPLLSLTAAYQFLGAPLVHGFWIGVFPFLAEPPGYSLAAFFDGPDVAEQMKGAWGVLALFTVSALFNTVIGEELLFRGLLLPRMNGVFGKWDWLVNGFLFGLYHLSQPWTILGSGILGALFFAYPSKRFRCAWFGIIAHSGQSIFFVILILGLVLGLA
jgi:membrane protease YdiL (CAAX protease family)